MWTFDTKEVRSGLLPKEEVVDLCLNFLEPPRLFNLECHKNALSSSKGTNICCIIAEARITVHDKFVAN
ncbi:hypothetical protein CR513_49617, partial [Mucuna pruriens]